MNPTPTDSNLPHRRADFATLAEALDYAARGKTGFNFYSARGELATALSYRELRERARAAAQGLVRTGLPRGARVVMIADTTPDFVVLFAACQYAGLLPVPVAVPTSLGGRDTYIATLKSQIAGAVAAAAIAPEELMPYMQEAALGESLSLIATPEEICALPGGGADLRTWIAGEPCYLQFSSGSTRFPKGIDIPQRALMANCHAISIDGLDIRAGDRAVSWLPLYHDMGLVGFMLVPITNQFSCDYIATRDFARRPMVWPTLISQNRASLSYSPTFGYDLCSRRVSEGRLSLPAIDLKCWRAAGIGGDMIQPKVLDRFAEAFAPVGFDRRAFVPSYGMAETTLAMSFSPLGKGLLTDSVSRSRLTNEGRAAPADAAEPADARHLVRCGRALVGHELQVRDAEGSVLSERVVGRIYFRGPSIMAGYYLQPDETARVLGDDDGWLETGDLGYMVEGEIVITGRSKDLIIIAGRNIWPQDLEWTVEDKLALRRGDTAAFAVETEAGEAVVLLIQCRATQPAEREALAREATSLLQRAHGVECRVMLIPPHGIPQTSSGKISRAKAKANLLAGAYASDVRSESAGSIGRAASATRA
jgi:fatty-acyl-CoA synthase